MGTFYVYVRKFMSFFGVGIEIGEEELRERPLKDGLGILLDNSISNDSYRTRVLVSHLPSDVSNCNESSWSSAEKMMGEMHSESCAQHKGLQFGSGINYDYYDSLRKESESDLLPVKIAKEVYKQQNKQIAVETSESSCSHPLSWDTTTPISNVANAAASVPNNRLVGNKADVHSSNMSIKEATSEESLSAFSGRNSLLSPCGTTTNYDADGSLKEKLTHPQKTSTETDSNPAKGKIKASRRSIKKAMCSLVKQIEKPTGESGAGRKKAHVHSSIKEVTSEKSLPASSRRKSLKSPCGKNNGCGDSLKDKLTCPKKTSLEPDSTPAKSSKVSKRKSKNASSSLVIQNAKPTGKAATSFCSDHQGSNSVTPLNNNATGRRLAETASSRNLLRSQKKKLVPLKICPQNRNTESVSRPQKSKKQSPRRHKRKAMRLHLRNIQNEQLVGESSNSLNSNPSGPNSIEQACDHANNVSARTSKGTSENGQLLVESNATPSVLDSKLKEESSCAGHLILITQSSNLASSSAVSCLVNGSTNTALEKAAQSCDLQPEWQEFRCLKNSLEESNGTYDSLGSDSFIFYEADDCLKEKLTCPQKKITEPDSRPLENKKRIARPRRGRRKALKVSFLKNQNELLIGESPTSSHSDPLRSNSVELVSYYGNDTCISSSQGSGENVQILSKSDSSPKLFSPKVTSSAINIKPKDAKMWVAKEKSSCLNHLMLIQQTTVSGYLPTKEQESLGVEKKNGSHESLRSDSFICEDDADSLNGALTCLRNSITEPDSTLVKSKKKASKGKGMKNCSLSNQNEKLIVEAITSDAQSLSPVEKISDKAIAISVSYGQLQGSTDGRRLVEPDTLRNELGSKKKVLSVPPNVTSDTVDNKKEVKQWMSKKKCSPKTSSLANGSAGAACKKLAEHMQSEFSSAADEEEPGYIQHFPEGNTNTSLKPRPVPKKTTSAIDSKQKEVQLWVPKDKSSSSDHPISTQQSQNLVCTLKKPFLVNGRTYDEALKKNTLLAFSAAPQEQESSYVNNSLQGSNGSQTCKKVITSPTNAVVVVERKIQGYCSSHKILLVGEGNFSFSACLARAFGSATNMVATSLNSEVYLQCYYKDAMDNIFELQQRGCKVLHDVDATTVANHSSIKGQSFDRIIYNFPHCGDFSFTKRALKKNQELVRLFMENSSKMIEQDGEIHIRHKTSKSFSQWDLKRLASEAGLVLIEEACFQFCKFKGYETKYGYEGAKFSSDDNFDCHPSRTYKFALHEHVRNPRRQKRQPNAGDE